MRPKLTDPASDGPAALAEEVRRRDWSQTPLGPMERWSPVLRSMTEMVLAQGVPSILLWGRELVQIYNEGYRAIMGDRHPQGIGQPNRECWPEVWHINAPIYDRVWAGETLTFKDALYPIFRDDVLEDAWFTLTYSPIRAEDGAIGGILVTVFETSAEHRESARREASQQHLRDSEARLLALVNASFDMTYRMSPDWTVMFELQGTGVLADTEAPRAGWLLDYIPSHEQARVLRAIDAAIADRRIFELEHGVLQADGSHGWVLSRAVPHISDDGQIIEWIGAAKDLTDRYRAEQTLRQVRERDLLVRELQHRTRNLLAVVSGIAQQTRVSSDSLDAFGRHFEQRLAALGRVQDFLTPTGSAITLEGLIALELAAHGIARDGDKVVLAGPDVVLPSEAVQLLGLAIHELTTNAIKHGAFAHGGSVRVDWTIAETAPDVRLLRLQWKESGLSIDAGQHHRGFGRELIETDLPYELDATTRLVFAPEGIVCTIELRLPALPPPAAD